MTSLRIGFSWTLGGSIAYNLCQLGILVLLAKYLPVSDVGAFMLALSITTPIILFSRFGLRQAQATDVRGEFAFSDYFGFQLLAAAVAMVVIALVVLLAGYDRYLTTIVLIVGLAKAIESQSDFSYGLCQLGDRLDRVAKSMVLRGAVSVAGVAFSLAVFQRLDVAVLAQLVSSLLVLLVYDLPSARLVLAVPPAGSAPAARDPALARNELKPRWRPQAIIALFMLVLPLGFASVLSSLQFNFPRYVIGEALGLEALGYFGALLYVLIAGSQVVHALGHSTISRLALVHAEDNSLAFFRLLGAMGAFGCLVGLAGVLIALVGGQTFLAVIYTPDYAAYADLFVLVMVAGLFRYAASAMQNGLAAARRFRIQMINQVVVAATAVVTSIALVPYYGLQGAAWAVIITSAAYLICVLTALAVLAGIGRGQRMSHIIRTD